MAAVGEKSPKLVAYGDYKALKTRVKHLENQRKNLLEDSAVVLEALGRVQQETKALEQRTIEASQIFEADRVRWETCRKELMDRNELLKDNIEALKLRTERLGATKVAAASVRETRRSLETVHQACASKARTLEGLKAQATRLSKTLVGQDRALEDMQGQCSVALHAERLLRTAKPQTDEDIESASEVPEHASKTTAEYHECGDAPCDLAKDTMDVQQVDADMLPGCTATDADAEEEKTKDVRFINLPDTLDADALKTETEKNDPGEGKPVAGEAPQKVDISHSIPAKASQQEEFHECSSEMGKGIAEASQGALVSGPPGTHFRVGRKGVKPQEGCVSADKPDNNHGGSLVVEEESGGMDNKKVVAPICQEPGFYAGNTTDMPVSDLVLGNAPSEGQDQIVGLVTGAVAILEATTEEGASDRTKINRPQEVLGVSKAPGVISTTSGNEHPLPSQEAHSGIPVQSNVGAMHTETQDRLALTPPLIDGARRSSDGNKIVVPVSPTGRSEPQTALFDPGKYTPTRSAQTTPIGAYTPCTDFGTPVQVECDSSTPLPMDMSQVISYKNDLFDIDSSPSEGTATRGIVSAFEKSKLSRVDQGGKLDCSEDSKSPILGLVDGAQKPRTNESPSRSPEVNINASQRRPSSPVVTIAIDIRAASETPIKRTRTKKSLYPVDGLRRSPRIAALQKRKQEELNRQSLMEAKNVEDSNSVGGQRKKRASKR